MGIGVDWASMDGNTSANADTLKASGITFAITRLGYGIYPDKTFAQNREQFANAKIPYGGFLFPQYPRPGQAPPSPEAQAKAAAATVGELGDLEFPIGVDVEFNTDVQKETGLSPTEMVAWIDTLLDTLESTYGFPSLIYTSARVVAEPLKGVTSPKWARCPLWVKGVGGTKYLSPYICDVRKPAILTPNLTAQPNCPAVWQGAWHLQQFQGDALGVPSMPGTTDLNRFHVMSIGATNATVRWIQQQLGLTVTGVWDGTLNQALLTFQAAHGLYADAIYGPATFSRLSRFPVVEKTNDDC